MLFVGFFFNPPPLQHLIKLAAQGFILLLMILDFWVYCLFPVQMCGVYFLGEL